MSYTFDYVQLIRLSVFILSMCTELDDFLQELDEDVEGMQSTILFLQQELKTTRDRIQTLEKENTQLRQTSSVNSLKESIDNAASTTTIVTNGQSISSSNNNQFQQAIISSKLDTIDENACLESTSAVDNYNGINNEQPVATSELIIPDEASNCNGSKNGAAARLARKRNYEEENTAALCVPEALVVPTMREISAPRILPPKKSKLRGIATRRNSQLEDEQNLGLVTATSLVLDNAVASMSSEEATTATTSAATNILDQATPVVVVAEEVAPTNVAAARILTRRRSVRMQQNGASGVDY